MVTLSNSLADLAEQVKAASAASADAERTAIDKALEAGALLVQAKEACAHGEWLPFLSRASVHERQARRLMQLSRSGLRSDTVSDLGGIRGALEWLSALPAPPPAGMHLVVSLDGFSPAMAEPFVVVSADRQGTWLYRFDLSSEPAWWEQPRRPVRTEWLWPVVLSLLDHRAADMSFGLVDLADSPAGALLMEVGDVH